MSLSSEQRAQLERHLTAKGFHATRQREIILKEFFRRHRHLTIEEWLSQVRETDPKIGYATVYRTLKLLEECGLAFKREFGSQVRYEQVTDRHHDHLICLKCGRIVEFENDRIEALQEKVCKKNRFQQVTHKMELYGFCHKCRRQKR